MFHDEQEEYVFQFLTQKNSTIIKKIQEPSDDQLLLALDYALRTDNTHFGKVCGAIVEEVQRRDLLKECHPHKMAHIMLLILGKTNISSERKEWEKTIELFLALFPQVLREKDDFDQYFIIKCASLHNEALLQYCLKNIDDVSTMKSQGKTLGHWLLYLQWGSGLNILHKEKPDYLLWKDDQDVTVQDYIKNQELERWIHSCIR